MGLKKNIETLQDKVDSYLTIVRIVEVFVIFSGVVGSIGGIILWVNTTIHTYSLMVFAGVIVSFLCYLISDLVISIMLLQTKCIKDLTFELNYIENNLKQKEENVENGTIKPIVKNCENLSMLVYQFLKEKANGNDIVFCSEKRSEEILGIVGDRQELSKVLDVLVEKGLLKCENTNAFPIGFITKLK